MIIKITQEVFQRFNPNLRLVIILAKEVNNKIKAAESKHLLIEVENLARLNFHKQEVKGNRFIEPWVLAQLEFAGKAHHYHTSVERLLKTVLKDKTVAKNNTLTNLTRYVSLKYLLPIGVDNFHKIDGDLTFDVIKSSGKKGILGQLKRGELYYHDVKGVLGMHVDYWKNKRTEVDKNTYMALIHLVALPPVDDGTLRQVTQEMVSLIETFCNAKTEVYVLGKNKREVEI